MGVKCQSAIDQLKAKQDFEVKRAHDQLTTKISELFYNRGENFHKTPEAKRAVDRIVRDFQNRLFNSIQNGIRESWFLRNNCIDKEVDKYVKGNEINAAQREILYSRNTPALESFMTRKHGGFDLSERVWRTGGTVKEGISRVVSEGLLTGTSAREGAKVLKEFLVNPDKVFRRVRDKETGLLKLSKPGAAFHPGQGVYRSSYKNALRLARTEINMAYRTADVARYQNLPFVVGYKVSLSNSHPVYDICDELQGNYPKNFLFGGWHPNCLCFVTPIQVPRSEFKNYLKTGVLNAKDYEIKYVPAGLTSWMKANTERVKGWKNVPYFIKDNFENTKDGFKLINGLDPTGNWIPPVAKPTIAPGIYTQPPKAPKVVTRAKSVPIPKAAPAPVPIPQVSKYNPNGFKVLPVKNLDDMKENMKLFAAEYPEYYARGFRDITHTTRYGVNGFTDMNGRISLKPDLMNLCQEGFDNISKGIKTTLDQETALSTLHHEILHNTNRLGDINMTKLATRRMELANEFVSRKDLPVFFERLGGKLENHELTYYRGNTGYNVMVVNYDKALTKLGCDKDRALDIVRDHLFTGDYRDQMTGLVKAMFETATVKVTKSEVNRIIIDAVNSGGDYFEQTLDKLVERKLLESKR